MVKAHSLFVKSMGKKHFYVSWAKTISVEWFIHLKIALPITYKIFVYI